MFEDAWWPFREKNYKDTMGIFIYLMIETNQDRTEKTENEDQ